MASTSPSSRRQSSGSSATIGNHDVESQSPTKISHFSLLTDQAGVTPEVLSAKYPGDGTTDSPYLVDFLPVDPRNPMTFSRGKKWGFTLIQAGATLAVAFTSSAYSGAVRDIFFEFGASREVIILGVSMFVLGFAIGPLIWAPLSEMYGRQLIFFITYMALTAFNAGAAGAPTMAALIVLRFFAGAFGSAPMTNAGAIIADMFDARERGIAASVFSLAPFLGPALGPIIGGFVGESEGWRWVEGLTAIFTGVFWILSTVCYHETYSPLLLRKRAAALSKITGQVYISKLDKSQPKKSVASELVTSLSRPWILLFREPIVFLTSIYIAIVYGTLYMCFAAFPIVFQEGRGWSPGIGGLAFLGISIAMPLALIGNLADNKRYLRVVAASPGGVAPPEARLPPAIVGSILLPIGLFWFAWTNGNNIHWVVPIIGSGFFGAGFVLVFLSLLTYLIETYFVFAASALAANTVLRSLFGAAFPLFTTYMYQDLGNQWASSIPAFMALACAPFPLLFYKYGATIRNKCTYAAQAAAIMDQMVAQQQEQAKKEASSPLPKM